MNRRDEPPPVGNRSKNNPKIRRSVKARRAVERALTHNWQTTSTIAKLTGTVKAEYALGILDHLAYTGRADRSTMHNPAPPVGGVNYIYLWRLAQPKETP